MIAYDGICLCSICTHFPRFKKNLVNTLICFYFQWMYVINQALLMYEKANDRARKASILANEIRRVSPPTMINNEVWSGERFVKTTKNTSNIIMKRPTRSILDSPPTSPASQKKSDRKLPPPRPANINKKSNNSVGEKQP